MARTRIMMTIPRVKEAFKAITVCCGKMALLIMMTSAKSNPTFTISLHNQTYIHGGLRVAKESLKRKRYYLKPSKT